MAVPEAYRLQVEKLRDYLRDRPELNKLLEDQESTDSDLYQALLDGLDYINYEVGYTTSYTLADFPSWKIIRDAAVLDILMSAGIGSARNTLTFNDGGGIMSQDSDVYGRYMAYYNQLVVKVQQAVQNLKMTKNIENGFGGSESAYGAIW